MADTIQHGIDDNPTGDAEKGAALGGIGGAVTGLAAGAVLGPVGAVVGAIIGGVSGAVASGAAVAAVDRIDNDNTVSGLGGTTNDANSDYTYETDDTGGRYYNDTTNNRRVYHDPTDNRHYYSDVSTGSRTYVDGPGATGVTQRYDESTPSLKTGGYANDGTPDTRGVGEKLVDGVTGDVIDDKTGKAVIHP